MRHYSTSQLSETAQTPTCLCSGIGALAPIVPAPPPRARELSERNRNARETAALLRAARLRDLLAAIAEWERASGSDRVWWRRDARHRLAEWRTLYRTPERAAFQQAVARSRTARP